MRHAKSDWASVDGAYPADIDRPLNSRGRRDAFRVAKWLAATLTEPVSVLVSPARRAQETAAIFASISADANCATEEKLYLASAATLQKVAEVATARCLILVAHNPGMEELVAALVPDVANAGQFHKLMPTMGVYGFECPARMFRPGKVRLLFHQRPKLLKADEK